MLSQLQFHIVLGDLKTGRMHAEPYGFDCGIPAVVLRPEFTLEAHATVAKELFFEYSKLTSHLFLRGLTSRVKWPTGLPLEERRSPVERCARSSHHVHPAHRCLIVFAWGYVEHVDVSMAENKKGESLSAQTETGSPL